MALACGGRATLSRAAASLLGTRAASATACSVAPRLRSGRSTSSPGVTPLTRKGSDAGTANAAWVSNVATCNVSRRQLSSRGGDVDYSSLMAGPGTALHDDIMESAARKQTGVSLKTLIDTGRGDLLSGEMGLTGQDSLSTKQKMLIQVASFLHRELPIRLAHRVRDLESVPDMLAQKSVQQVREWYVISYEEIRKFPRPVTVDEEVRFAELLKGIYQRHAPVLLTMARGVWELRESFGPKDASRRGAKNRFGDFYDFERTHTFLDGFYMSRIGIRILIGHYLALQEAGADSWIGMVCQETSPAAIAEAAIEDAKFVCTRQYGDAPDVTLHGRLDLTFSYVPSHLHYIMLELIKNSMRATVDFHGLDEMDNNPIRVVIADGEGNEDVVIKVADEGGGIRRSYMTRIWSYLFTTADPAVQEGFINLGEVESDHAKESPLAGLGYGLPISRSYARYFGGDLSIVSMEGYGTDAFVHLSRLGHHSEPLP
ncbi:pyruvate dehydrogenase kinase [Ectocarpus siliculosus]|uniref:Protein-serine/threonine kinase n=1 Tax=Ectocarpus siliculosus TaxID=2880 RepID=D7FPX6_ECTSI|nr:pyruvate dehydrogenase kinase [Ectocarpus siliculosus]|eukprot:CBJ48308.1 pyruvate dehydrogenase kinase [Ectocarpus siliculosus]